MARSKIIQRRSPLIRVVPHYFFNRGNAKARKGDHQGAVGDFSQALDLNPRANKVWTNRGLSRIAIGDRQGAIDDLNQSLALDPTDAVAFATRGDLLINQGDRRAGIQDLQTGARLFREQGKFSLYRKAIARISQVLNR